MNKNQLKKLMAHAKHHTNKHIQAMTRDMQNGKTFAQAHKNAMKKVGKWT